MKPRPLPRGTCSGCGGLIPVRLDGLVKKHSAGLPRLSSRGWEPTPCKGSDKPPRSS